MYFHSLLQFSAVAEYVIKANNLSSALCADTLFKHTEQVRFNSSVILEADFIRRGFETVRFPTNTD